MYGSDWRGPLAFIVFGIVVASIAVLLAWDMSATLTEQRIRYEKASEAYTQQAEDGIQRDCGADLDALALRSCIREKIESAEDGKRAERDLDAQEGMALFTRLMGFTGLIGLLVGVGSVYLIWATLRATQVMARDTREIGEAQVRAYLSIDKVEVSARPKRGIVFWDVVVTVRNSGQSPARGIQVWASGPGFAVEKYGGIMRDLPSGGHDTCTVIMSTKSENLRFRDEDQTEIAFDATVWLEFTDVFSKDGTKTKEGYRFVGLVSPVEGEVFKLNAISFHMMMGNVEQLLTD